MSPSRSDLPGLTVVVLAVVVALVGARYVGVSALVIGVALGAIVVNVGADTTRFQPGFTLAARRLLRVGIVLLGFRLSFDQLREFGVDGVAAMVVVVVATFVGVQLLGRAMGLSPGLSLLVGTGYGICGASAVAAMEPLSDADEEETAYAIGLVTLCGSLSIVALPALGNLLGLRDETFGTWAGAGVHDVGQVAATASAWAEAAVPTATLVKLTRVVLLAPMMASVGLLRRRRRRRQIADGTATPESLTPTPIVPLFIVLFIAAIAVRATDVLSDGALDTIEDVEKAFLTAGMFGLGAGVQLARLRRLGGRPLVLGLASWVLVAGMALAAAVVTT